MLTKIHGKNFKSFDTLDFDLSASYGNAKKIAIIYGPNGSGKTQICEAVSLLKTICSTMQIRQIYDAILTGDASKNEIDEDFKTSFLRSLPIGMESVYKNTHMIGSEEPVEMSYDFILEKKTKGSYTFSYDKDGLVNESLDLALEKRHVLCFKFTRDGSSNYINLKIFPKKEVYKTFLEEKSKFWGKHSFFAILQHMRNTYAKDFLDQGIHQNVLLVLKHFLTIQDSSIDYGNGFFHISNGAGFSPFSGSLSAEKVSCLEDIKQALSLYLASFDTDYQSVDYFTTTQENSKIKYNLVFNKMVAGKIRQIPYTEESEGICRLIAILPTLLGLNSDCVVVIDEIDRSLHPSLLSNILKCILSQENASESDGQLIITTHNPIPLSKKGEDFRDSVYFILKNEKGQKLIKDLNSFNVRTYKQNNVMESYLNGGKYVLNDYKSVPKVGDIDFDKINKLVRKGLGEYFDKSPSTEEKENE